MKQRRRYLKQKYTNVKQIIILIFNFYNILINCYHISASSQQYSGRRHRKQHLHQTQLQRQTRHKHTVLELIFWVLILSWAELKLDINLHHRNAYFIPNAKVTLYLWYIEPQWGWHMFKNLLPETGTNRKLSQVSCIKNFLQVHVSFWHQKFSKHNRPIKLHNCVVLSTCHSNYNSKPNEPSPGGAGSALWVYREYHLPNKWPVFMCFHSLTRLFKVYLMMKL